MAEEHDSWLSALGVDVDKYRKMNKDQSAATTSMIDNAVGGVINDMAAGAQSLVDQAPIPQGLKDVATTGVNFEKGVYEGVFQGVKGLVGVAQSAGELVSGVTLAKGVGELAAAAVSEDARKDLVKDVTDDINKATAMGNMIVNPIGSAVSIGSQVVTGYEQAAAKGQGAEFIGKGVGLVGVVAATAALGGGEAEVADLATAGEEAGGVAEGLGEGGIIEKPTYVSPGESIPPQTPGTAPTEFPPDPTPFNPTLEPGPAPDLPATPPSQNPYVPFEEGGPSVSPFEPNIPRPPRLPEITPEPTKLPPGGTPGPGMPEGDPVPAPPPEPALDARPDPRVDPEPAPDTIEDPPVGPQPPREPAPDTLRDPPAFPQPPRETAPQANLEAPDGPATEPRLDPGEEPLSGSATQPAPPPEVDPATQPRPAPGEDIPSGPATEPRPATLETPPSTEDPVEPAPDTAKSPTFPNDPPSPYEGQPPVKVEDPDAEPPPSTQDPPPSTQEAPPAAQDAPAPAETAPPSTQDAAPSTQDAPAPAEETAPADA